MEKFKVVVSVGFVSFTILSLASWAALNVFSFHPQRFGWGSTQEWVLALWIWGSSTAIALYFFAAITQVRPLGQHRARLYVPSVVGLTLVAAVLLYALGLFWSPVFGIHSNAPIWGVFSYWAKHALIVGLLLLQVAFVYSYRPTRYRVLRSMAVGCTLIVAVLFMAILFWPEKGPQYIRLVALLTLLGAGASLGVWLWRGKE